MRSILVTGCRRGIGLELVKQLAAHKNGPKIIITTVRNIENAQDLVAVSVMYPHVKILELDNTEFSKMNEFAEKVAEMLGEDGLNCLLHNAGILTTPKLGTIEELTADQLTDVFKTNTIGPIMLTKSLLPLLRKASRVNNGKPMSSDRSGIFFISSFLGSHALNDRGGCWGYRESKASINMAMCTLKIELANDVIGTQSFHPGWVKTDMGGQGANVDTTESVRGIIKQIFEFSKKSNGSFCKWDGTPIPW